MKWLRQEKRIATGTIGPNESYSVEVVVEIYWNTETQQEEEAFDGEAMRKIEEAIEAFTPAGSTPVTQTRNNTAGRVLKNDLTNKTNARILSHD